MSEELHRRKVLKGALVVAGVAGVGLAGALPANAATADSQSRDQSGFPVVPGMKGDRRANELWYTYEDVFNYNDTDQIEAAYNAIGACTSYGSIEALYPEYQKHRAAGTFPDGYTQQFAPAKDAFAYLTGLQLGVHDRFYKNNPIGIAQAFFHFGEGTLYDPRMPVGHKNHIMDYSKKGTAPPTNFHAWHCIMRATVLLGIDPVRWTELVRCNGIAWETQSRLKPKADCDTNPAMDPLLRLKIEARWATMSVAQIDDAFDSYPYPKGIS